MFKRNWKFPFLGRRESPYVPRSSNEGNIRQNKEITLILEYLASIHDVSYTYAEVHKTLGEYWFNNPNSQLSSIHELLAEIAPIYSLSIQSINRALIKIQDNVSEMAPWTTRVQSSENADQTDWLTILQYRGGKYKVSLLGNGQNEFWLTEDKLLKLLNISSTKINVKWIISRPKEPLGFKISKGHHHSKVDQDHHTTPFHRLYSLLRVEKRDIWIIVIYGIAIGILSLVVPVATSSLVNIVAFGVMLQPVIVLTFLVFLFLSFAGVMQAIQTYITEILQRRIFVRVATDFASRFPQVTEENFDDSHPPEIANRFFDTMTLQKGSTSLLVEGLEIFLTTIIGFFVIAFYHPVFLIFSLAIITVAYILIFRKLGVAASETSIKVSKEKYYVAAWLQEIARHRYAFKSKFGAHFASERADSLTRSYLTAREKHFKYLFRQIIGLLGIQAIGSALVLGLGGYLVINRQLTIGQLVAAELIVAKVLFGLGKLGKHLETFYHTIAAVDKLGHVTDLPTEETKLAILEKENEAFDVRLTDVHYELKNGNVIFDKLSLHFPAGKKIAIAEGSTIHCTMLIDLIASNRVPKFGTVEISGEDIRDLSKTELRSNIALIRDREIFDGTILENLKLGRLDISNNKIKETLDLVGLTTDIDSLPEGLNTNLKTYGSPLNPIQINLLLIARALLGNPGLVLIDCSLDSLDQITLEKMVHCLFKKDNNFTVIVISNEMKILSKADDVYFFKDNKFIKSNKNLLASSGRKK
ncbi:MAG: ABC transporter ATP-binding protein [Leptospira sp.]|nr:MAG: ABC transporter ATP-binding protein [Leptospira sp.]